MATDASETICESVASEVRYIERGAGVGRKANFKSLLSGTRLRFIGYRGGVSDYPGIFRALFEHFNAKHPTDFHISSSVVDHVGACWRKTNMRTVLLALSLW